MTAYGTAKLTRLMAAAELAARLPVGMAAYSANPGLIRTGFNAKSGGVLKVVSSVSGLFAQAPSKAARTPVLLATATAAPNGGVFTKGAAATPPAPARDTDLATRAYQRTARALGVDALPAPDRR